MPSDRKNRLGRRLLPCVLPLVLAGCGGAADRAAVDAIPDLAPPAAVTGRTAPAPVEGDAPGGPPPAPAQPQARAADHKVTLTWEPVPGATGYHLYYAQEPGLLPDAYASYRAGVWVRDVQSPYVVQHLPADVPHYFVITAVGAGGESAASLEVAATPEVSLIPALNLNDSAARR